MSEHIVCIGGLSLDINATSAKEFKLHDSLPGYVNFSLGGVATNIAHNLALLQEEVYLLAVLGQDIQSKIIKDLLAQTPIDYSYVAYELGNSGCYCSVADENGEMQSAIADTFIGELLSVSYLRQHTALLEDAKAIVCDCNLSEEVLVYLIKNYGFKLFIDGVSTNKVIKLKNHLKGLKHLKVNIYEGEALTAKKEAFEIAKVLNEEVEEVCISLSDQGFLLCRNDYHVLLRSEPEHIVSTSGAGDALVAGLVYSDGINLYERARFALSCAYVAMESEEAVNKELDIELIDRRYEDVA